jgi:hypothetical protein
LHNDEDNSGEIETHLDAVGDWTPSGGGTMGVECTSDVVASIEIGGSELVGNRESGEAAISRN